MAVLQPDQLAEMVRQWRVRRGLSPLDSNAPTSLPDQKKQRSGTVRPTIRGYGGSLPQGTPLEPLPVLRDGPGTEYEKLAKDLAAYLGIKLSCDACAAARDEMNRLGIDGCKQERARLLTMLRENAEKVGIKWDAVAVTKLITWGIRHGMALSAIAHLGDLTATMLDMSIMRSKSK